MARPLVLAPRRPKSWKRGVSLLAVASLATVGAVAGASPASAAPIPVSQSTGTFLSGSLLGTNLDNVLKLQATSAVNNGGPTVTDARPLDITALSALNLPIGPINLLTGQQFIGLGAANQVSVANPDGSSTGASGAVNNQGAIAVGGQPGAQSNATIDLSKLLGTTATNALANLTVSTGAISATATQAAGANGAQSGTYQIADLKLALTSQSLATIVSGLNGLVGALPLVGNLINGVTTVNSLDGSIVANLQSGVITIDVAKLVKTVTGKDINQLPPNTELLPYITQGLTSQLLPALSTSLTTLLNKITGTGLGFLLTPITDTLNNGIRSLGSTVLTPLAIGLENVLSLKVNVQENAGGTFTERALRVGLLQAAPVSIINLASASVGPNAGPAGAMVPTTLSLNPDHGPVSGGTTVVITGTGFTPGSTVTIGGQTVTPTNISADGTMVTFTTPAHPVGPVDVTVTSAGGTSTAPLTYTYEPLVGSVPTTISLTPTHGPAAGGTTVVVTGTGFTPGSTVSIGGLAGTNPVVTNNGTTLTFTTPTHAPGPVDVTVTSAGGTSTPPLTYTYDPNAPTVSTLNPDHGPVSGGTSVTITGTGFTPGSTVSIGGQPGTVTSVSNDGTTLTFTTPAHPAGPVPVTVTTAGGTSGPLTYTYDPLTGTPPTAATLNPTNGPASGGTSVTITGTGFVPGSTVLIGGQPGTVTNVSNDGTMITFTTPPHAPGPVQVTVTTPGGITGPLTYTYNPDAPVIFSPPEGGTVTTPTPPITGTGTPGATVTVNEGGTVLCTTTVQPDGSFTCTPTNPLANGAHTITATQTINGATSPASAPRNFTVGTGNGTGAGNGAGAGSSGSGAGNGSGAGSSGAGVGNLAYTGVPVAILLGGALLALLAGSALLVGTKRRRSTTA